jgi:hypothetical protein
MEIFEGESASLFFADVLFDKQIVVYPKWRWGFYRFCVVFFLYKK